MRKSLLEYQVEKNLGSYEGTNRLTRSQSQIKSLQNQALIGCASSRYALACRYDEGNGVEVDRATARIWFLMGAKEGHVPSMFRLGHSLIGGQGLETNRCQGLHWLLKAANRGSLEACTFLGQARLNGRDLPQSDILAVRWFREGANRGCANSILALAFCHMRGRGLDRNPIKAYACLAVANARSSDVPLMKLERQEQLTAEQIAEVERHKDRILVTGNFDL